ncbi:MAG TPA: LysM domain-containing protein [Solirubrobacteraceae bacterium]|jgi:LysM repeat protein|nr:LysM domain-containing protein [Solirubrobacteraceae bacterium]
MAAGALSSVVVAIVVITVTTLGASGSPSPGSLTPRGPVVAAKVGTSSRCCWIVQPGQTLYSIAARESLGPADLQRVNPDLTPDRLAPGQRVRLPA